MLRKLLLSVLISLPMVLSAAYIKNQLVRLEQPDGSVLNCFASGDEFVNYLHDADGYTIIQGDDGYYYYAEYDDDTVIPSQWRVGKYSPKSLGLNPGVRPSQAYYNEKRRMMQPNETLKNSTKAVSSGNISGIVIFIRFADEEEFTRTEINKHLLSFNNADGPSMEHYYKKVSYDKLHINNQFFPHPDSSEILSYKDINPKNYYEPHNATSSPNGYENDDQREEREQDLLRRAVTWVKDSIGLPDENFDSDGDGRADFVSFILKSNCMGWSDLLWAHKWQMHTGAPEIAPGLSIYVYTFMPNDQATVGTICHEAFHAFGSPDLYHYNASYGHLSPCGSWDIMDGGDGHMSAFMKKHYTDWLEVEELDTSGTYVLYPQAKTNKQSAYSYKANKDETIYFEFRKKDADIYESYIPGSGLIVSRENKLFDGNSNYNGVSKFDEFYIFRPGGSVTENGLIREANLSDKVNRNYFGSYNERGHQAYTVKGEAINMEITNIIDHGDSLSFDLNFLDFVFSDFTASEKIITVGDSVHFTNTSTGNFSDVLWSFPGGTPNTSTEASPSIVYNTVGWFGVSLTISGDEVATDTKTERYFIRVKRTVSNELTDVESLISIHPNPTNGIIHIDIPKENAICTILDISGKTVKQIQLTNTKNMIDLRDLKQGIYFLQIRLVDGNTHTYKVIRN